MWMHKRGKTGKGTSLNWVRGGSPTKIKMKKKRE